MSIRLTRIPSCRLTAIALALAATGFAGSAAAQSSTLIVSSSVYTDPGFSAGSALPYSTTFSGSTVNANSASSFCANTTCSQNVWNNASVDGNFGITSQIDLQFLNSSNGSVSNTVNVTSLASQAGINLATSFSSKSELAINLTPDGQSLTFMGYSTTIGQLDVSNSNAYTGSEPGNTDTANPTQRGVGQISIAGALAGSSSAVQFTTTGAYSGNNGRAAVLGANGLYYTVGNAGNGSGSTAVTNGTGVQLVTPGASGLGQNNVGAYNITQNGYAADKTPKDSNYRGETIFNNTLYVTKGSGSNGIDTVYQVGSVGSLPAAGNSTPVAILPGFNTQLAKTDAETPHPFGLWFANSTTLYVADEGSGASTDFGTSPTTQAGGLDKYSLVNGVWTLDYELRGSLIGSSYTVNGTGALAGDSLTTTTDGLRNLTGQINANGTVTLYAVTSTEGSALGDAGADPNKVVAITDNLAFTTASQASGEDFTTLQTAALGQVERGVALTPTPLPAALPLIMSGLGLFGFAGFKRRRAV